jgi:hypothetical protein
MRENKVVPVQDNADEQFASPADDLAAVLSAAESRTPWMDWLRSVSPTTWYYVYYFTDIENLRLLMVYFLDVAAIQFSVSVSAFVTNDILDLFSYVVLITFVSGTISPCL